MIRTPSTRKRKATIRQDMVDETPKPKRKRAIQSSTSTTPNSSSKSYLCAGCGVTVLAKDKHHFFQIHARLDDICKRALFHCPNNDCSYFGMALRELVKHASYTPKCNDLLDVQLSNQNMVHNYQSTGTPFSSSSMISIQNAAPIINWGFNSTSAATSTQGSSLAIPPSIVDQHAYAHHHNLIGISKGGVSQNLQQVIFQGSTTAGQLSNDEIVNQQDSNLEDNVSFAPEDENDFINSQHTFGSNDEQSDPNDEEQQHDNNQEDVQPADMILENKLLSMDKILLQNLREASFDKSYVCFLELESTLRKASVPNNVFDKVMRWAIKNSDTLSKRADLFTRKKLYLDSSRFLYGSLDEGMRPTQKTIMLPSGRLVAVTTFDIINQIYSLLECPFLNKGGLKNTIFQYGDENHPFRLPVDDMDSFYDKGYFDDVESCLWYIKTYLGLNLHNLPNEILVPIIGFLDGTVLNGLSSHNIEPFMFTIGIFKRLIRNHPKAWKSLGYLEDLFRIIGTSTMSAEQKMEDYHFILDHVMEGMKKLTTSGGLLWTFKTNDGKHHTVRLHFRLMMIIGDTKGADVWVGRYGSHMNTSDLCRDCDMLTANSDDPQIHCKINRFSEIEKLDEAGLARLSMRRIKHNAFRVPKWLFGASPYGVCVACPPEPLHVFLLGTIIRVYQFLTDQFTKKQVEIFQRELTIVCNQDMGQRGKQLFPSMSKFSSGNYDIGHLTGSQKYARVFAMYLTLLKSDVHAFFIDKKGKVPSRVKKPPKVKKAAKKKSKGTTSPVPAPVTNTILLNNRLNQRRSQTDDSSPFFPIGHAGTDSDSDNEELHNVGNSDEDSVPPNDSNVSGQNLETSTRSPLTATVPNETENALENPVGIPEVPVPIIPKATALLFTQPVYNDLIFILEECLVFYQWLITAQHRKKAFKGGRESPVAQRCRRFMEDYKRIAPRLEGMGLKLVKFHHLSHWYFYIQMYGSPLNYDGGPLESAHKDNVKNVGRRTQQRSGTLTYQTGIRTYEKNLEERCAMQCHLWECDIKEDEPDRDISEEDTSNSPTSNDLDNEQDLTDIMDNLSISKSVTVNPRILGPYFRLDFDYTGWDPTSLTDCLTITWLDRRDGKPRKMQLPSFDLKTMNAFHQKMRYYNCGKPGRRIVSILGGIGLIADNDAHTVLRATPSYRSGKEWFDYITYNWNTSEGTLPAKVKIILDYSTMVFETMPVPYDHPISSVLTIAHGVSSGIKIMMHSATPNVESRIVESRVCTWYEMEKSYQIVSPTNIKNICFCLPDTFDSTGGLRSLLHVTPKVEWSSFFFDYEADEYDDTSSGDDSDLDISFTDIE